MLSQRSISYSSKLRSGALLILGPVSSAASSEFRIEATRSVRVNRRRGRWRDRFRDWRRWQLVGWGRQWPWDTARAGRKYWWGRRWRKRATEGWAEGDVNGGRSFKGETAGTGRGGEASLCSRAGWSSRRGRTAGGGWCRTRVGPESS
ncbi:hypothetical protein DFJ73DRAFT_858434 [Zopfochytrium polystomum]|nr:hypothetical protein DFJ73DRAFT_858434 [Zopfochytrium polystomum]